ncbi:nucleotide exchange factor GrpE [Clostridium sp.]
MSEDKRKQELMEEESAPAKECQEESGEVQAEAGEEGLEEAAAEDRQADTAEESEAAEGSDITGEEEPGREEKKSFFKKKKDPRDERIEALTDQVKRQMAEFENFRKRTDKEKSAMYEMGARDIIERILPVVDNLERGLAAVPEAEKGSSIAEGMEKIYKQFQKTLEEAGVKAIEAVGQEFNPDFHNAVMHVEDEALGENIVAEELQKGYLYRENVVRHSMVKVAN